MSKMLFVIVGGVCIGAGGALAMAREHSPSYLAIEGAKLDRSKVHLVDRRLVESAAVVAHDLSEQPVRPHLMELRVIGQPVYIDADSPDTREMMNELPAGHRYLKALAAWHSRQPYTKARVVTKAPKHQQHVAGPIEPRLIIQKPNLQPDSQIPIPNVPAAPQTPEKEKSNKVASL